MLVIRGTHAVLPEPLGYADEPRLLVRQLGHRRRPHAAVRALLGPGHRAARPRHPARPRADVRGSLLRQLAAGAKDEQIARTLGIGLRTVRRRVADLMIELGADTRFQAGVEAARRGWL